MSSFSCLIKTITKLKGLNRFSQRAENGALHPWSLNLRFWSAPIFAVFSAQRAQNPYFEGFRSDLGQTSGAPRGLKTLILKGFGAIWGKNLGPFTPEVPPRSARESVPEKRGVPGSV